VAPHDPPRGDEGLDDWFARRLESHGIDPGRRPGSSARVLAVGALAVAVVLLVWVLYSAGGSGTSSASSPATPRIPPAGSQKSTSNGKSSNSGTANTQPVVPWNQVHVTVLNSTTTPNLAGNAQATLQDAGWKIAGTGDASPALTSTEVVYPPGKKVPAQTVAKKLRLTAVPESSISGFATTPPLTTVAVVLGPGGLSATG
jgi:LytR cell envelope-related transcriptional attenuator